MTSTSERRARSDRWGGTRRRVAVTGMGIKAPGGTTVADFWATLRRGRSVAGPIERFDASSLPVTFGCEVQGFSPADYVPARQARRIDRAVQLAIGSAVDAVEDAGPLGVDPDRAGVVVGTSLGGVTTLLEQHVVSLDSCERVSPLAIPTSMPNAAAAHLGLVLGWTGPNLCLTTACAAGAHAIGEGARLIRDGTSDAVLAGGTDSCVHPFAIGAFWRMGLLSDRNDAPEAACRPFDRDRTGFVLGEGAGFLVLEEWQRAQDRGATIHAELLGYGRNCDAAHITSPSPGGVGAARCIELALDDGGIAPSEVRQINAHGTGTAINDRCEADAIVKVFGVDAPPVTATKSIVGHLLGAAGAVEAIATVLSVKHREVPPTANFASADPDVALDVVADRPRPVAEGLALSSSFAFGGHNAALVFGG